VLQRNWRGFTPQKQESLANSLKQSPVDVILLSETHLSDEAFSRHKVVGYRSYHRQRTDGPRGGVGIMVRAHPDIKHALVHTSSPQSKLEAITVKVTANQEDFWFTSIYVNNGDELTTALLEEALPEAVTGRHIVTGDFNVHHAAWDSHCDHLADRGLLLLEWAATNGLEIANEPQLATRKGVNTRRSDGTQTSWCESSPDVTMSRDTTISGWTTTADPHSDHHSITFTLGDTPLSSSPGRAFWNLSKADWSKYTAALDECVPEGDITCSVGAIERAIMTAARSAIPKGFRNEMFSLWSPEMETAEKAWKATHLAFQNGNASKEDADSARETMSDIFRRERNRLFMEKLAHFSEEHSDAWRFIRNRGTKSRFSGSILKTTSGEELKTSRAQANAFVKHYAAVASMAPDSTRPTRIEAPKSDYRPFSWDEWQSALGKMNKGRAVGPCDIPIEFIVHASERVQRTILSAVNNTLKSGDIPESWLRGEIIPLHKPGKTPQELGSYRPVTLTSHLSKLAERMVARRIIYVLDNKLNCAQFGFRHGRSTVDAVARLVHFVTESLNNYEKHYDPDVAVNRRFTYAFHRVVSVLIDFSSAFDTIDHSLVIKRLLDMGVPRHETRWVRNFIANRTNRVRVDNATSKWTKFTAGVPQGTVLGPLLFIVAMDTLLVELAQIPNLHLVAFADDLTVSSSALSASATEETLQRALNTIADWCTRSKMKVNVSKTKGLLFTSAGHVPDRDSPPSLKYSVAGQAPLPVEVSMSLDDSRLLGIHLDRKLSFVKHVGIAKAKTQAAQRQLAALTGPSQGMSRSTLSAFINGYAVAKLLYGAEVFYGSLSPAQIDLLDQTHRSLIRAQSGLMEKTDRFGAYAEAHANPTAYAVKIKQASWIGRLASHARDQKSFAFHPQARPSAQASRGDVAPVYKVSPIAYAKREASAVLRWAGFTKPPKMWDRTLPEHICPWTTARPANVVIVTSLSATPKAQLSETEQKAIVEAALEALGPVDASMWTDGSAHTNRLGTDRPATSGAAAAIYVNGSLEAVVITAAGLGACSKTAEAVAIQHGLRRLLVIVWEFSHIRTVLIATDSQSLLKALAAGPLDAPDELIRDIWTMLCELARRLDKVVLHHVYSHCGVAENEFVDTAADRGNEMDQSEVPLAPSDLKAMAKARAKQMWRAELQAADSHRVRTWGITPPSEDEASWPRAEQTVASRLRTNVHPDSSCQPWPTAAAGALRRTTSTQDRPRPRHTSAALTSSSARTVPRR
jgi:ribonuclease HI